MRTNNNSILRVCPSLQARYRSAGAPEPVPRLGPRLGGPGPYAEPAVGLRPLRGDERADVQALGRLGLRGGIPRRIGQARTTERPLPAPADVAYLCVEVAGTVTPTEVCLMNFVSLRILFHFQCPFYSWKLDTPKLRRFPTRIPPMALTHRTNLMPPEVPPKPAAPAPPPRRAVSQMALNSAGGGKENLYSPDPENISPWRENSNAASTTNGGLFTGTAGRRRGLQVFSGGWNESRIQLLLMAKMHGSNFVIL